MGRQFQIVLSYDDPHCGGAAEALISSLQREEQSLQNVTLAIRSLAVADGQSHRDALYTNLQSLFQVKHEDLFIISLLKGDNAEEYRKIHAMCQETRPPINQVHVLTHLANYQDVGLTLRNMVRRVSVAVGVAIE